MSTPPSLDACLALQEERPISGVSREMAERVLGPLSRGEMARWGAWRGGALLLVGAVVDTCDSKDDVADLFPVAGAPGALSEEELCDLLAIAEEIAASGPRSTLEVSLLPDRLSWRPALERRGYALSYTLFQMRRPPDPCRELPPPAGLRWEAVSEQTVADYYRVVGLAFREIPGAMVPEIAEFSRYALSAHPPAQLLMRADHVVGYARADWGEGTAEVASIGLDPSVRGLGLGDVLLTRALSLALSHHPREVTLVVAAVNDRATRLYLRHGFLPSEEIPVYRKATLSSDLARPGGKPDKIVAGGFA